MYCMYLITIYKKEYFYSITLVNNNHGLLYWLIITFGYY
jgi:hypothetical protein